MLKQKFVFAVSLIAMVTVGIGAARADIASTVYVQQGVNSAKTAASAAQTSANNANTAAVNAQGSADAAQAAAEAAQESADEAAASAKTANDTVATKFSKTSSVTNAIVTTDGSGNVAPVAIVDSGSGTYVTDVTVSSGKVTLSRGTPASYSLPTASSTTKGGVKIGANVNVATDGTISVAAPGNATLTIQRNGTTVDTFTANASTNKTINITDNDTIYTLPAASSSTLGGVKIGSNITNSSGTISVPVATSSALGVVKTGTNITNSNGTISVATTATPTSGSDVPLTSGGAFTALSGKQATLSAAQLSAANSGITSTKVSTYDGYAAQISAKEASANKVSSTADAERVGTDTAFPTVSLVNSLISTANNELGAELSQKQATLTTTNVTTTGSGNVVTAVTAANGVVTVTKGASLPTVNNATLTIQRNGTTVDTFSANASSNKTINITDNDTIYTLPAASSSTLGGVKIGSNISNSSGTISVPVATSSALGVVKTGTNITNSSGTISVTTTDTPTSGSGVPLTSGGAYTALAGKQATLTTSNIKGAGSVSVGIANGVITVTGTDNDTKYTLPAATDSTLGGVKIGSNISNSSGTISVPAANGSTLGVVKAGTNVSISSGAVSVATGTPTTLGVVKVGQIPSGGETSTNYATIWVQ